LHLSLPVVPDWVEAWALRNGCSPDPVALSSTGEVDGIQYSQCAENAEVNFYTIQGGGHSWSGGEPLPGWIVGKTTQDIDATEVMWQFFTQHPLAER
jgi:polyhydroxybutyrate depolymerase